MVETSFYNPCMFLASLSVLTILNILMSLMMDKPVVLALPESEGVLY
jgi:hypothetical protein